MKLLRLSFLAALVAVFFSCSKDDSSDAVSSDDAAEIVSLSLASNSAGATSMVDSSVGVTTRANTNSSLVKSNAPAFENVSAVQSVVLNKDTSFAVTSSTGAKITYSLTASFSYTLAVSLTGVPQSMAVSYQYNGSYDAPKSSSTHSGSGSFAYTNLANSTCTLNGSFERNATVQTKSTPTQTLTSKTNLTLTNLNIAKLTRTIQSGSATVTITGTSSTKGTFSFTGTITFQGSGMAELTINSKKYLINLVTGDVTAE